MELENSVCPNKYPEEILAAKQTGFSLPDTVTWKGRCGTGKQRLPEQVPRGNTGSEADRIFSAGHRNLEGQMR
ncbi:MAG: hypothetical protein K2O16_01155, partial [Lachnospiraceae bacterium]|nr:hypothetical protein [Lachnospiraceae bacterium]